MAESEGSTPEREAEAVSPKKKRKGCVLTGLTIFLVLGIVGVLFLNGPGFRLLAHFGLLKALGAAGYSGDFRIEGTLGSGFTLRTVNFSAETEDTGRIEFEEISLRYSLLGLLRKPGSLGWLEQFHVRDAQVHLVLPEASDPPPDQAEDARGYTLPELDPVWGLLAADLLIEDLTLFVHQGNRVWSVERLDLALPREGSGHLRIGRLALPDQPDIAGIDATITRREDFLEIGPLPLREGLAVETLALRRLDPAGIQLDMRVDLAGGSVDASVALREEAKFALTVGLGGEHGLDLSRLPLPALEPLRGSIDGLDLGLSGSLDRPATWQLEGKVEGGGIGWEERTIDTLALKLVQNVIQLEVRHGRDVLAAEAIVPIHQAAGLEDLATLPVEAKLDLALPELGETLAALALDLPLAGALRLSGSDFRFSKEGLFSGVLALESTGLAWEGTAVAASAGARVSRPGFVEFQLDLGLDEQNAASATGSVDLTAQRYEATATLAARLPGPFGQRVPALAATTGSLKIDYAGGGTLTDAQHRGTLSLEAAGLTLGDIPPIDTRLSANYEGASAVLETLEVRSGDLRLTGTGNWDGARLTLPDWQMSEAGQIRVRLDADLPLAREALHQPDENAPVELQLTIDALALGSLAPYLPEAARVPGRIEGTIEAGGSPAALKLGGELTLTEPESAAEGDEAADNPQPSRMKFALSGPVRQPNRWDLELEALIGRIAVAGRRLEGIAIAVATEEQEPTRPLIARVRYTPRDAIVDANFRIDLSGAATIPQLAQAPITGEASVEITEIATVLSDLGITGLPLTGSVSASLADLRLEQGSLLSGVLNAGSDNAQFDGVALGGIKVGGRVTEADTLEAEVLAAIDGKNRIDLSLRHGLKSGGYSGTATLRLDPDADSGRLRGLLERTPVSAMFPTRLALDWAGAGDLKVKDHEGKITLDARGLTLASGSDPLRVRLEGFYDGPSAEFPTLNITGESLALDGSLLWRQKRLDLSLKGSSGSREALDLRLSAPVDPDRLTTDLWFAQEEELSATIRSEALPLRELARWFQAEPKLQGRADIDIALSGSPSVPQLTAAVKLDELSVPREGNAAIAAGKLDLKARSADGTLAVEGLYQHPEVKPFELRATLPFHPGAWARKEIRIGDEAIAATAKMERSSLAFLKSQVPGIETIAGEIALDATVGGTVASPEIKGHGALAMSALRFENRLAPSLQDIALEANFADNAIRIDRLSALVAGGTLEGGGAVRFEPGGEPQVDFKLKGAEVLVFRNTDVSIRTDLDVALSGPFSKAAVTGHLALTNCRYFRNFDLLPVGMPTKRNVSALPTVERAPRGGGPAYADLDVGVAQAPFHDWPLDLRIYTKDPFLIRSNLVESGIEADLRITGTLGTPNPVGSVSIAEGDMSLPFSKVTVETGRIVFDEATGFNGAIEFKARGKADRYRVSIYVYDRIFSPQYVLTSIPPLPTEDIMTLLVTGTTRSELTEGDASLAAGKAAGLLLKNLRQKSNRVDGERTLLDALEERTELELGRVNPETGEQTFGGRIRLWKQLFFVGDVDVDSDYRALLKYVFRLE